MQDWLNDSLSTQLCVNHWWDPFYSDKTFFLTGSSDHFPEVNSSHLLIERGGRQAGEIAGWAEGDAGAFQGIVLSNLELMGIELWAPLQIYYLILVNLKQPVSSSYLLPYFLSIPVAADQAIRLAQVFLFTSIQQNQLLESRSIYVWIIQVNSLTPLISSPSSDSIPSSLSADDHIVVISTSSSSSATIWTL